jgi:hypothetical protein
VGPQRDEGSQGRRCQEAGSRDHAGHEGCRFRWHRGICNRGKGPRMAPTSQSARSMLPVEQGASIAATSGDGTARAPPGAGPQRFRALEASTVAWFSKHYAGAPMRRGPPAPGAPTASSFGLFWLPEGHPRRFIPAPEDPAAVEEAEGSMAQGRFSSVQEYY